MPCGRWQGQTTSFAGCGFFFFFLLFSFPDVLLAADAETGAADQSGANGEGREQADAPLVESGAAVSAASVPAPSGEGAAVAQSSPPVEPEAARALEEERADVAEMPAAVDEGVKETEGASAASDEPKKPEEPTERDVAAEAKSDEQEAESADVATVVVQPSEPSAADGSVATPADEPAADVSVATPADVPAEALLDAPQDASTVDVDAEALAGEVVARAESPAAESPIAESPAAELHVAAPEVKAEDVAAADPPGGDMPVAVADPSADVAIAGTDVPSITVAEPPVPSAVVETPAMDVPVASAAAAAVEQPVAEAPVVVEEKAAAMNAEQAAIVMQTLWRGRKARKLLEMQTKRARVAKELLETEQTYVSSLEMMIRLYMKPLLASARTPEAIMPRAKVQAIFSVVEVMTNLNKVLLEDLKKRLEAWHVEQVLGDIFLAMGDYLKVATQFVNNYETAVATISGELKANARFKVFYDETRELPECKKNDLKAFLIMPVQRIPRYEMLLRELIRRTPPGHPDCAPLNEAYHKIQSISVLIDNRKDDNVRFQEVVRVHSLLEPKVPQLIAPTRRFVLEMVLLLHRKGPKPRPAPVMCFLFNDILILAERIEEKKTIRHSKSHGSDLQGQPRFRPKETLTLLDVACQLFNDQVVLKVAASGKQEEVEWVLTLPDGAEGNALVDFAKAFAKARQQLEANSNSSHLARKAEGPELFGALDEAGSGTMLKRSQSSNERSEGLFAKREAARAALSQSAAAATTTASPTSPAAAAVVASAAADSAPSSPALATQSSDVELLALAEQTKQGTLEMLTMMVAETEAKLAQLQAEAAAAETSEEDRARLVAEAKIVENKVATMRVALQQQAGVGTIAKQNALVRSRSSTDPQKPKSFSLRPNGKEKEAVVTPSPPSTKKGIFGSVRAKKKSQERDE